MKKYILIFICFVFSVSVKADEVIKYNADDIKGINVHFMLSRIVDNKYNFIYNTDSSAEIEYFMHALSSVNFIDDGKQVFSADGSEIYIEVTLKNNSTVSFVFVGDCRFIDSNNNHKQYLVDLNDYNCFADIVYALNYKLINVSDHISFEPSDWAKSDVDISIKNGLLPKMNQIDYNKDITRLEVCELADNLLKIINPDESNNISNPFSDTKNKSVAKLYELGIIQGKSESEFKPYDFITREEFSKILMLIYDHIDNDKEKMKSDIRFIDESEISDWALENVKTCADIGLLRGDENARFNPKDNVSKEECIVTLNRLYKIIQAD